MRAKAKGAMAARAREQAMQQLGLIYNDLGDYAKAQAVYTKLTELKPKDPDNFLALGETAVSAQDTDTAILAFGRYLQLAPDSPRRPGDQGLDQAAHRGALFATAQRERFAMSAEFDVGRTMLRQGLGLVTVSGEVDIYTAPRLKDEIVALIDEGAANMVVDLSEVTFIDSTALGVLIGGIRRVHTRGR